MTKRQPGGTPVGGQFAEDRKPEGADLSEPKSYLPSELEPRPDSKLTNFMLKPRSRSFALDWADRRRKREEKKTTKS